MKQQIFFRLKPKWEMQSCENYFESDFKNEKSTNVVFITVKAI